MLDKKANVRDKKEVYRCMVEAIELAKEALSEAGVCPIFDPNHATATDKVAVAIIAAKIYDGIMW